VEGVVRTRVGYTGGTSRDPGYHNLGDHSESIQIDYDPNRISYGQLLEIFWASHNPVTEYRPRQYASFIFYHDQQQKAEAVLSKERAEAEKCGKLYTGIVPFTIFYMAEDYHQKYYLQQELTLFKEFSVIYPQLHGLVGSTAAARINGYLAGYGTDDELRVNVPKLGLSPSGIQKLLELRRRMPVRCA
jgi:methionine-S-sulfoxide reductase